MSKSIGTRGVQAKNLKPGDWIAYSNARMNERVVKVQQTRDGQIKVNHDYGNGGEPATSFYDPNELITVI